VRRLKKLLRLPESYRALLLKELEKPRSTQTLTVDHVIEASNAAEALRKRKVVSQSEETELRDAIISKFRTGVINNTVAPRQLVKLSRAVERGEVDTSRAKRVVSKLISEDAYSIDTAYQDTAQRADLEHSTVQLLDRLTQRLADFAGSGDRPSIQLRNALQALRDRIDEIIR
jgi:hypothetical protein